MLTPRDRDDTKTLIQRILLREEIAAERLIAWIRIGAAAAIGATFFATVEVLEFLDLIEIPAAPGPRQAGPASFQLRGIVSMIALFLTGALALFLARPGRWRSGYAYALAVIDAGILVFSIFRPLWRHDLPANFAVLAPALFAVPIAFALNSLRPRPKVHYTFIALFIAGLVASVWHYGILFEPADAATLTRAAGFFDLQNNLIRLLMLTAAGITVAIGVERSRALLQRSVEETQQRKALTRFLPGEIAPRITGSRFDALRRGERRLLTIMFVDIRDSTAIGEAMDPVRLSVFISSFRRRVMRASRAHGGVVDKFIGDGALVLFGLNSDDDGAAAALAAAQDLLALIARWNTKRNFNPAVRIGIGIHTGEAYLGVIGAEDRLEFTVLGDAVNVAARLEQMTKQVGLPALASASTIAAAQNPQGWRIVGDEPLRGRSGELTYCGLIGEGEANTARRVA